MVRRREAATAPIAFLAPRRALIRWTWGWKRRPLVLAAAQAHEKSVAFNQRDPLRIRVDLLLPALASLRGQMQAQERRWASEGKRLISTPISEKTDWALRSSKPGMVFTIWVASRKGSRSVLTSSSIRPIARSRASICSRWSWSRKRWGAVRRPRRAAQLLRRAWDPLVRHPGQDRRIGLAGDHRLDHRPTADAQDVGDDRVKLDVAVLQRLLQPLNMGRPRANQVLWGAQQGPQLLGRTIGHKAAADQAVSGQLGKPGRIVHVGLATGHGLHMRGVGQHQFELTVREDMPDRLPIDPRGFHGRERASLFRKPRRQVQ